MLRRLPRPATAVVAAVLLAAGCADEDGAGSTDVDPTSPTTIAEVSEVGQRRPWDGMVLPPRRGTGYGSDDMIADLAELAELGAPNVAVVVPVVEGEREGAPRRRTGVTPRDDDVEEVLRIAEELGLGRVLELRLDPTDDGPGDDGPGDEGSAEGSTEWFEAYAELATHYGELAQRHDASLYVLDVPATAPLDDSAAWTAVLDQVEQVFRGPVAFSVPEAAVQRVEFWDQADVIGVSTSFPDPLVPEPIAADIEKAWEPAMAELTLAAERWGRPVVLTRVGVADRGWATGGRSGIDEELQVDAYEALFTVANQTPAVEGILLWHWGTDPAAAGYGTNSSPEGRPAEAVLRRAWTTPLAGEDDGDGEDATGVARTAGRPGPEPGPGPQSSPLARS